MRATGDAHGDYAFGYEEGVQTYLQLHTVERCADFLRPHLKRGISLLDAGCGPGTITVGLAALVAPGHVAAVDISPDEVATTSSVLSTAGYDNAHVGVADVAHLPFDDGTFAAVFSHACIDYLPDPSVGVRELFRVLKPGGVIGLRSPDNDLTVIGPHDELVAEGMALFRRVVESMGGNVTQGRMLGARLKEAGFERIYIRPSLERIQSREEWPSLMHAFASAFDGTRVAEIAVGEGWVNEDRIGEIVAAFERFGSDTSNCFALPWCEALGFRPL